MNSLLLLVLIVVADHWLYSIYWRIVERFDPLIYRDVPQDGLEEHFRELQIRGGIGAIMVVRLQESGKTVRLRKYWDGTEKKNIPWLELILDEFPCDTSETRSARKRLKELGLKCKYGTERGNKFNGYLVCDCRGDVATAAEVARLVFKDLYRVPVEELCSVQVKGRIMPHDRYQHGKNTLMDAFKWGRPAKPYKRWQQLPGMFYWVKPFVRKKWPEIKKTWFPPRGPGHH